MLVGMGLPSALSGWTSLPKTLLPENFWGAGFPGSSWQKAGCKR